MKPWYRKKQSWICSLVIVLPVLVGISRDWIIQFTAKQLELKKIVAEKVSASTCNLELCKKSTQFVVGGIDSFKEPAAGFYGAHIDSYLAVGDLKVDSINRASELRFTWHKFRVFSIRNQLPANGRISIVTASPIGTKKIGMDTGFIFFGEEKKLAVLHFIFSLFNIHLYLFLAFVVLSSAAAIVFSAQTGSGVVPREVFTRALISASALIAYSKVFNDLLYALHTPTGIVSNLPHALWGATLVVNLFPRSTMRHAICISWVAWIGFVSMDWSLIQNLHVPTYRWFVLTFVLAGASRIWKDKTARFSAAYVCLAAYDCATLHGLVPVKAAVYMSPLGICGLFISAHFKEIVAIFEHHKFWYERKIITQHLQDLRNSGSDDRNQWLELLAEVCGSLSSTTRATRVSLCYLGFDSPLILSLKDGRIEKFQDGQLPPVFARVIQTKEPLWWATQNELSALYPAKSINRSEDYKSNYAVVLPIMVSGEPYGALALTDFEDSQEIMSSEDKRHQLESIITSFLDIISSRLVKKKEASSSQIQKRANEIIKVYSNKAIYAQTKEEAIGTFLEVFSDQIQASAMYFSFDAATERLQLVSASKLPKEQETQWRELPFRARSNNRLSPFAISINERRCVFIENIQSFFNFLAPQSVDALSASGTKGFVCSPVCFGDSILGLFCALDEKGQEKLSSDVVPILDLPLKYLAYQLEQHRMSSALVTQEKALSRFADPKLASLIAQSIDSDDLAIGETAPAIIIVHDLRGSTEASRKERDAKLLAIKFAQIYEKSASIAATYDASYDKCNGDGTITTMPTTLTDNGKGLELALRFLDEVHAEANRVLDVKQSLVCVHRGVPFRGVLGTTRRVAWDICGADISDTFSLEKAAKIVPGVVFAISSDFLGLESLETQKTLRRYATKSVSVSGLAGESLMFDAEAVQLLRNKIIRTLDSAA